MTDNMVEEADWSLPEDVVLSDDAVHAWAALFLQLAEDEDQ